MIIRPLIQLRQTVETPLRGMTNISKSFVTFFIETIEMYLSISKKINFTQMARFGRSCESRFRDDVRLRYIYQGPKSGKRGRPKQYDRNVDIDSPDMNVFSKTEVSMDRECYTLFCADVWAVGLGRKVRVVIADCPEPDKKTQKRKVFFSTDFTLTAESIFLAYRSRFQIEFCYRDAKQITGLTHCQARNREALAFAFNMSLASVNVAKAIAAMNGLNLSVESIKTLMHNASMLERFISMRPYLHFNHNDFKELLFYGVRDAA